MGFSISASPVAISRYRVYVSGVGVDQTVVAVIIRRIPRMKPREDRIFAIQVRGFAVFSSSHEAAAMPPRMRM